MPKAPPVRNIAAVLSVLFGITFSGLTIYNYGFKTGDGAFDSSINRIGNAMMETGEGGFSLPFEVVSILLLAAMVGCIVIAIKSPEQVNSEKIIKEDLS